jgi:hypothetical protein
VPGAHAYNPRYSGGRDQENRSLKPAWGNSSQDPISKKPLHKKIGLVGWLKIKALYKLNIFHTLIILSSTGEI